MSTIPNFSQPIILSEVSTPLDPDSGFLKVYAKSGALCSVANGGSEQAYLTSSSVTETCLPLSGGTLTGDLTLSSGRQLVGTESKISLSSGAGGQLAGFISTSPVFSVSSFGGFRVENSLSIGWANFGSGLDATPDLRLYRGGAGILEQRNGLNAQCFDLFETYTSSTNNGKLRIKATSSGHQIGSARATSGSNRAVQLGHFDAADAFTSAISVPSSGDVQIARNLVMSGTFPYFGLTASSWSGGTFYFQAGVDETGTGTGNFTCLINPVTKSFAILSGNPNTSGKKHLTIDGSTSLAVFGGAITASGTVTISATTQLALTNSAGVQRATINDYGSSIRFQASSSGYPIHLQGNNHGIRVGDGTYTVDIKPVASNSVIGFYTGQGTTAASGALADIACGAITASGKVTSTLSPDNNGLNVGFGWTDNGGEIGMSQWTGQNRLYLVTSGTRKLGIHSNGVGILGTLQIGTSMSNLSGGVTLTAGGDDILRQRNGLVPQTFQIANTYTSSTSFGVLDIRANSGQTAYEISSFLGSAGGANLPINVGHRNSAGTFTSALSIATTGAITASDYIYGTSAQFSALGAFGGYGVGSATLAVQALNSSTIGMNIRGQSGQTADLLKCKTSANTDVFTVGPTGAITASGAVTSTSGFNITDVGVNYRLYNAGGVLAVGTWSTAPFAIYTNGIERLRVADSGGITASGAITCGAITASGNVNIGANSLVGTYSGIYNDGKWLTGTDGYGPFFISPFNAGFAFRPPAAETIQTHISYAGVISTITGLGLGTSDPGTTDVRYYRNATGPKASIRAAGGLEVRDLAGSADAGFTCGAITASGAIKLTDGTYTAHLIPFTSAGNNAILVRNSTNTGNGNFQANDGLFATLRSMGAVTIEGAITSAVPTATTKNLVLWSTDDTYTQPFLEFQNSSGAVLHKIAGTTATFANLTVTTGVSFIMCNVQSTGYYQWGSRSVVYAPATGQFSFRNNAETAGATLDVTTDGTLTIKDRAGTATGNLSCGAATVLGKLKINGAGGSGQNSGEMSFGTSENQSFGATGTGAGSVGFYWTDRNADSATSIGGSYNALNLATAGAKIFQWKAASVEKAYISVDGSFVTSGAITASGAVTVAQSIACHSLAATTGVNCGSGGNGLQLGSNARIYSSANNTIKFWNEAITGAPRLNLGGDTSSFAAIQGTGTAVNFVLADGTGASTISCGAITASGVIACAPNNFDAALTVGGVTDTGIFNYGSRILNICGTMNVRAPSAGTSVLVRSDTWIGWNTNTNLQSPSCTTTISQSSAGVLQIGTTAANGSGSLLLTNLTASGTVTATSNVATNSGQFIANASGQNMILLNSAGTYYGSIGNDAGDKWSLGYKSASTTALGTPVLTWTSAGFVGINKVSPTVALDVNGAITASGTVNYVDGTIDARTSMNHALTLRATGAANAIRVLDETGVTKWAVDSTGSMTIGTLGYITFPHSTNLGDPNQIITAGGTGFGIKTSGSLFVATGGTASTFTVGTTGNVTCGAITTSKYVEATEYLISNQGRVFSRANGSAGFLLGASDDCNVNRIAAGVIGFGTGSAGSTAAEIRCGAITASGTITVSNGGSATIYRSSNVTYLDHPNEFYLRQNSTVVFGHNWQNKIVMGVAGQGVEITGPTVCNAITASSFIRSGDYLSIGLTGVNAIYANYQGRIHVINTGFFGIGSGDAAGSAADVVLGRDSANVWGMYTSSAMSSFAGLKAGAITASGIVRSDGFRDSGIGDHYLSSISHSISLNYFSLNANGLKVGSNGKFAWYPTISVIGTEDANITRNAAGVLQIGTTSANALGSLLLTNLTASSTVTVGSNDGASGRVTVGIGLDWGLKFGNRGTLGAYNDGVFGFRNNATTSGAILDVSTDAAFKLRNRNNSADAALTCGAVTVSKAILQSTEITSTPSGTTQTIVLNDGNHQTLNLTSATGTVTITLTVPTSSSAGTIIVNQHATAAKDITWTVSSGTIKWMGTQPTWSSDATSSVRLVSWRWNGSIMYLVATDVGT